LGGPWPPAAFSGAEKPYMPRGVFKADRELRPPEGVNSPWPVGEWSHAKTAANIIRKLQVSELGGSKRHENLNSSGGGGRKRTVANVEGVQAPLLPVTPPEVAREVRWRHRRRGRLHVLHVRHRNEALRAAARASSAGAIVRGGRGHRRSGGEPPQGVLGGLRRAGTMGEIRKFGGSEGGGGEMNRGGER
jgi:hypothetical protein